MSGDTPRNYLEVDTPRSSTRKASERSASVEVEGAFRRAEEQLCGRLDDGPPPEWFVVYQHEMEGRVAALEKLVEQQAANLAEQRSMFTILQDAAEHPAASTGQAASQQADAPGEEKMLSPNQATPPRTPPPDQSHPAHRGRSQPSRSPECRGVRGVAPIERRLVDEQLGWCLRAACIHDRTLRRWTSVLSGVNRRWHGCCTAMLTESLESTSRLASELEQQVQPTRAEVAQAGARCVGLLAEASFKRGMTELLGFQRPAAGVAATLLAAAWTSRDSLLAESEMTVAQADSPQCWKMIKSKVNYSHFSKLDETALFANFTPCKRELVKRTLAEFPPDSMRKISQACGVLSQFLSSVQEAWAELTELRVDLFAVSQLNRISVSTLPQLERVVAIKTIRPAGVRIQLLRGAVSNFVASATVDDLKLLQLLLSNKQVRAAQATVINRRMAELAAGQASES
eukprot:TRINITY_DN12177_c0_g1_i2.p1 TRINITY_DN12177_c0_g1~~TRINITY_DN12177_c0_g1_i2.p1  ORF type:complete len:457 (-),score=89.13 TRINITY_DN12177_c0_g1_i2:450-1820(-)